jgi:hypothetical protein
MFRKSGQMHLEKWLIVLVDLLVGLNFGLKRDYGSKTKERKNSDTKDCSFDIVRALPLVAMLSC